MKKIILGFFALITVSLGAFAQDGIGIFFETQTTDISGKTYTIDVTNGDVRVHDLFISNNTNSAKSWVVTRKRMTVPSDWSDFLCFGHETDALQGGCYPANNYNPWTTPSGDAVQVAIGERAKLTIDVDPADANYMPGALYRYYIGPSGTSPEDSVDIQFSGVAGIKQLKQANTLTVSPNPASENLFISADGIEKGTIKIVDVLGNVVYSEVISAGKKVDVSEFKNGIYFVMIDASGYKTMTRKIVVRH